MSSKEKFAASLKDVFAVKGPQPPPPPSSRRPRPVSSSPPPPPSLRAGPRASAPPGGIETDAASTLPPPPDSLIPVRFADLLHEEAAEAVARKRSRPRPKFRLIGGFVAGAVAMLAGQVMLTRTSHEPKRQPPPLARPPATALPKAPEIRPEPPQPPVVPAAAPATSVAPATTADPVRTGAPESATAIAPESRPSADAVASMEEATSEPQPIRRHRKRARSSSTGYEIPTAEFPDPGK